MIYVNYSARFSHVKRKLAKSLPKETKLDFALKGRYINIKGVCGEIQIEFDEQNISKSIKELTHIFYQHRLPLLVNDKPLITVRGWAFSGMHEHIEMESAGFKLNKDTNIWEFRKT